MKKVLSYLLWLGVFTSVFMVLFEQFNFLSAMIGLIIALLSIFITDRLMLDEPYRKLFKLNPLYLIRYTGYLIYRIIGAGFHATWLTLSGRAHVRYFCYNSHLHDDLLNNILANSITLTPGTVTIDKEGNKLLIMQLVHKDHVIDMASIKRFEKVIAPIKGGRSCKL